MPADGRVAGHFTNGFKLVGEEQGGGADAGGRRHGFAPGVAAANDDNIPDLAHRGVPTTTPLKTPGGAAGAR